MADKPLLFEPGKLYSYSNAGFALLGILIEEKSGTSYANYIRTRIFEPAGMEDSLVYPGELETEIPLGYGMGEPSISFNASSSKNTKSNMRERGTGARLRWSRTTPSCRSSDCTKNLMED